MKGWGNSVALILIISGISGLSIFSFAQSINENETESEVVAAWNNYIENFSARRTDVLIESIYAPQSSVIRDSGSRTLTKGGLQRSLDNLASQGYEKSETQYLNVCVLNQASAIVNSVYLHKKVDGSILAEGAGTYLFVKFPEGWRIMSFIAHSSEQTIQCAK